MSEASGREQTERRLVERSLQDESFRQRLLEDPRSVLEEDLGTRLPEGVRVVAVEETAETIYLVLPSASPLGEGDELSDQDLEAVASGAPGPTRPAQAATPAFAPSGFALVSSFARHCVPGSMRAGSAGPCTRGYPVPDLAIEREAR